MIQKFDSLFDLLTAFPTELSAIKHFEAIRWKHGAHCPHCGSLKVYHFSDGKTHKCGDCRKRFSIKVGTIFEDSKIPMQKWFMAIWLLTSHKKGIASTQLAKDISVTQKTAWFMLHRLRCAAKTKSFNRPLSGTVEADETYIGGKSKNMHQKDRDAGKQRSNKTIVVGVKQRNGDLRTEIVADRGMASIQKVVRDNVATGSTLITDENHAYRALGRLYSHETVRHAGGEYVRGDIHTNTIESVWALLKRQIIGIHHFVSPKHLQRYLDEMVFRQNRRDVGEGNRVNMLLAATNGKRLRYKELIA